MTLPSSATAPPTRSPAPRWVVHPAFFAAAYVLDIALANEVEPAGFIRSMVVAVAFATTLTLVAWAATRDRLLGGLIALGLLLASVSLRPFDAGWEWVRAIFGGGAALTAFAAIMIAILAVPAMVVLRARQGAAPVRGPLTSVLNRLAAVLLVVVVIFHVAPDLPGALGRLGHSPHLSPVNLPAGEPPDIYMVLVDGYPRADILSRRFGIDNQPFLAELRDRGFDVAESSRSNYVFTQLTLASMFQMRHIDEIDTLVPLIGSSGPQVSPLRAAITDGPVLPTLRAAGYQVVVNLSGYEHVALRGEADRVLDHGEMNDVERGVLRSTWLLDLIGGVLPDVFAGPQRDRIVNAFNDLEALAAEPRADGDGTPIFAWVHVPAPHLPLVVGGDGSTRTVAPRVFNSPSAAGFGMTDAQLAEAYAEELTYLNSRLLRAAATIQDAAAAAGRPKPVIVFFSDHGWGYDKEDTQARFANLLAASTPGSPGLLDGSTPVNLFPSLLNRYLGTDFALSKDRYFLSTGSLRLLELTEVSNPDVDTRHQ